MSIQPPDLKGLAQLSEAHRLGIAESDLPVYHETMRGLLGSWSTVEQLYEEMKPTPPDRSFNRPNDADNQLGAWYVQTDIQESEEGPLAGRTVAIKDNVAVAGIPMMNGSHTVEGFVPLEDATVVARLLAAGATIKGKAVCEDLCFSGGSHTSKPGPVRNPWDTSRSAGGSSSGSAALVASGQVDLAVGGDQGGSIRIPAAYSGLVGHKPTHGLVPYTGAFPIEQSIDHLGPIGKTVTDVALMLSVIAGPDQMDPRQPRDLSAADYLATLNNPVDGLRIGVVSEGFGHPNSEPEVDQSVRAAVDTLRAQGLTAEEVSIPWHAHGSAIWDVLSVEGGLSQMIDQNAYGMNWKGHYDPALIEHYGRSWRGDPAKFSETVKLVYLTGRHSLDTAYGRHYAMARNLCTRLNAEYDKALDSFDVLVMPTLPLRATPLPSPEDGVAGILGRGLEMLANTAPFDVSGHPACSVPAGVVDGLPVGMMIVGKAYDDATVLRVARAYEEAVGGFPVPNTD